MINAKLRAVVLLAAVGLLIVGLLPLLSGCNGDGETTPTPTGEVELSGTITEAGSTSVQPLAEALATAFEQLHPKVTVNIGGGGSSVGVKSCADGTVDIGAASRELKMTETDVIPIAIARDAVAIVVHPDNTIEDLTLTAVKDIYAGEITNWSEIGGPNATIEVVSREEGSGTRDCFESKVMSPYGAEITAGATLLESNGAIKAQVATTPSAIGYLSLGYVTDEVKAVGISMGDGKQVIEPTVANCRSGEYPVLRRLYLLTREVPTKPVKAFLDFCRSEEGQQIVEQEGYVPLAR
jgi:phosphate transport system substrate-binding protein